MDGQRLEDVEWNGRVATMFTIDLRERADPMKEVGSGS